MMNKSMPKPKRPAPTIRLNAYDYPQLADHKVGDKVELTITAEITSISKENDYYFDMPMEEGGERKKILHGSMEIKSVEDKKMEFKSFKEEKEHRLSTRK